MKTFFQNIFETYFLKNQDVSENILIRIVALFVHETSQTTNLPANRLPVFAYNNKGLFQFPGQKKHDLLLYPAVI